jgi:hypothetical protein
MNLFHLTIYLSLSIFQQNPDEIRTHFEWGDYPGIIKQLEPLTVAIPDSLSKQTIATYFSYLGVAYFADNKPGMAKNFFIKATEFNESVSLDTNYVTAEIKSLFLFAQKEYFDKKRKLYLQYQTDSTALINKQISELNRIHAIENKVRRHTISRITLAVTSYTAAIIFGERLFSKYSITKDHYANFKSAASVGNLEQYEQSKENIEKANARLTAYSIAASLSCIGGIYFTWDFFRQK